MKNIPINFEKDIKYLFNLLDSEDEKYECLASIPGPLLELRSGYLLPNIKNTSKFVSYLQEVLNLQDSQKLKKHIKNLKDNFSFWKTVKTYNKIVTSKKDKFILMINYLKFIFQKISHHSNMNNATKKFFTMNFCFDKKNFKICYPNNIVSTGIIWEIFLDNVYSFKTEVKDIYDFGANIGLSAIYFKNIMPNANIFCIEPLKSNIEILKKNLNYNNIEANIIEAGAGKEHSTKKLFFSEQSNALPSTYVEQSNFEYINIVPYDDIIKSDNYGIKIDTEGAEAELAYYPDIVYNASWIVGELHYSTNIDENLKISSFFNIVKNNFEVEVGRPIMYFVGEKPVLCKSFKTIRKYNK